MEIFQVSRTGHYPTILIYADKDYDATDQWWMIAIFLLVNKREFIWLWEGRAVAVTGCEKTLKSQNLGATKQKKEKIYLWKENLLTMMMMMMMMMMMTMMMMTEMMRSSSDINCIDIDDGKPWESDLWHRLHKMWNSDHGVFLITLKDWTKVHRRMRMV